MTQPKRSEAAQAADVLVFSLFALCAFAVYALAVLAQKKTPEQESAERCLDAGGLPVRTAEHKIICLSRQTLLLKEDTQ